MSPAYSLTHHTAMAGPQSSLAHTQPGKPFHPGYPVPKSGKTLHSLGSALTVPEPGSLGSLAQRAPCPSTNTPVFSINPAGSPFLPPGHSQHYLACPVPGSEPRDSQEHRADPTLTQPHCSGPPSPCLLASSRPDLPDTAAWAALSAWSMGPVQPVVLRWPTAAPLFLMSSPPTAKHFAGPVAVSHLQGRQGAEHFVTAPSPSAGHVAETQGVSAD